MKVQEVFGIILIFMASLFIDILTNEGQKLVLHGSEVIVFMGLVVTGIFLLIKEVE